MKFHVAVNLERMGNSADMRAVRDNEADRQLALDAIRLLPRQFENPFRNAGGVTNGFPARTPLSELEGREQYDPAMLDEDRLFGTPNRGIAKVRKYQALGVDAFINYASMDLDPDAQKRSMRLFCDEVIPAFQ